MRESRSDALAEKNLTLSSETAGGSPERFGYAWSHYFEILPEHELQFRKWTTPLQPADWNEKRFLDVGCGIGRNSYWAMRCGAAGGLAIDIDERTLAAARKNLSAFPGVEVRCQSAYDPLEANQFDIVFSIGVVHHLEFPERAIASMVEAVKPGGTVLVWLYGYENNQWIVRFADPLRTALFSKLPLGLVHAMSWVPTVAVWVIARLGLARLEYFRQLRHFSFRHLQAIVFDQMIPRIARYYRKDEAIELLASAGLVGVEAQWINEMSWTVIGRKSGP